MRFLETLRASEGQVAHLSYHQARLERTLRAHGIDAHYDLASLLDPPSGGLWRCRILYDEHGIEAAYHPYTPQPPRTLWLIHVDTIDYMYKYADRSALDALQAQNGACDSVLIVQHGHITDTPIANVAFLRGGLWYTPDTPLLEGTTRARLIDEGRLHVRPITVDELSRFEGFALLNAMLGFHIVQDGIMALKS